LSCVGSGWPESRRSVEARSMMNVFTGTVAQPEKMASLDRYTESMPMFGVSNLLERRGRAESLKRYG
jgi:hypothetical protein